MATAITTNFNYTYNGKLSTEIMEKKSLGTPSLSDFAKIHSMLRYKEQIPILSPYSKILKAESADCSVTYSGTSAITNRTIEVKPMTANLEWCYKDFQTAAFNVLAEQENMIRSGAQVGEPGDALKNLIDRFIIDALRRDSFRVAFFGDTDDANEDYNQLDGVFTKLIANSGDGATYAIRRSADLGTGDLAADAALTALRTTFTSSSNLLDELELNEKYLAVTRSVYDNLVASYESVSTGSDLQVGYTQDGIPTVRFRGVEVKKVSAWDAALADPACPLNGTVEHIILYTWKENHVFGVERESDFNSTTGWYSQDDNKFYFRSRLLMGYNYFHSDYTTIAY